MWVGKLGKAQAKLNKSALKGGRLKAMLKSWEDLQTILCREQERRKMILENMRIKYSREFGVSPSCYSPDKFWVKSPCLRDMVRSGVFIVNGKKFWVGTWAQTGGAQKDSYIWTILQHPCSSVLTWYHGTTWGSGRPHDAQQSWGLNQTLSSCKLHVLSADYFLPIEGPCPLDWTLTHSSPASQSITAPGTW